jgi:hypothetical protein
VAVSQSHRAAREFRTLSWIMAAKRRPICQTRGVRPGLCAGDGRRQWVHKFAAIIGPCGDSPVPHVLALACRCTSASLHQEAFERAGVSSRKLLWAPVALHRSSADRDSAPSGSVSVALRAAPLIHSAFRIVPHSFLFRAALLLFLVESVKRMDASYALHIRHPSLPV